MKRDYDSGIKEKVQFFVGNEIEKTDCFKMKTLFVTGFHTLEDIKFYAGRNMVEHIYLGANHSFDRPMDGEEIAATQSIIKKLIKYGYKVTVDVDHRFFGFWCLAFRDLKQLDDFYLNVSIKIADIESFKNTTFKLDDIDFNETNRGVWVYKLQDKDLTLWDEYKDDKVLTVDE